MGIVRLMLHRFASDESGATAIEYGLIAALIGVLIITAAMTLGDAVLAMFDYVRDNAGAAMNSSGH